MKSLILFLLIGTQIGRCADDGFTPEAERWPKIESSSADPQRHLLLSRDAVFTNFQKRFSADEKWFSFREHDDGFSVFVFLPAKVNSWCYLMEVRKRGNGYSSSIYLFGLSEKNSDGFSRMLQGDPVITFEAKEPDSLRLAEGDISEAITAIDKAAIKRGWSVTPKKISPEKVVLTPRKSAKAR